MIKPFILLLLLLSITRLYSQTESGLDITFLPTFGHDTLVFGEGNHPSGRPLIETLKFYISKISLSKGDEIVFAQENSYHLLNAEDPGSLKLHVEVPDQVRFTTLNFYVGVDSTTTISGAFGDDLDPTKGMYWTWQSGYINFKLEGTDRKCPTRNNRFQFHIGGYQYPFNTLQEVELPTYGGKNMTIQVDLAKIFQKIDLAKTYQMMSPGQKSVDFSNLVTTIFSMLK